MRSYLYHTQIYGLSIVWAGARGCWEGCFLLVRAGLCELAILTVFSSIGSVLDSISIGSGSVFVHHAID